MISKSQKMALYKEGWLPSEIYALIQARGGDTLSKHTVKQEFNFNSKPFKAMRNSRKRYIQDLKNQGWNGMEIKDKILSFYRGRKFTDIFSFLKLEYRPNKRLSDFQAAVVARQRSRISRVFGRAYGRVLRKESRPKNLPKRPLYPSRPKLVRRYR